MSSHQNIFYICVRVYVYFFLKEEKTISFELYRSAAAKVTSTFLFFFWISVCVPSYTMAEAVLFNSYLRKTWDNIWWPFCVVPVSYCPANKVLIWQIFHFWKNLFYYVYLAAYMLCWWWFVDLFFFNVIKTSSKMHWLKR